MTETMRAVRFETFGAATDVLTVQDLPVPPPGPGQCLIRMTHRPINPSDTDVIRGAYGRLPKLPATPGLEGVGTIAALDPSAPPDLRLGQRVIPLDAAGTWAQYIVAPTESLLPVPDALPDEQAAQFVVNPVTAWAMLTDLLRLRPGDWLVQTAAGSTLGHLILQLAPLLDIRTVNVVRRPEQAKELEALGAHAAFSTDTPDLAATIRALTGGGAHAAIDAVGGQTGKIAAASLRHGGTLVLYGWLSRRPLPLNVGAVLFNDLRVRGFWLARWLAEHSSDHVQRNVQTLMDHMASGAVRAPIGASFSLEQVHDAVALASSPGRRGKVLLTG